MTRSEDNLLYYYCNHTGSTHQYLQYDRLTVPEAIIKVPVDDLLVIERPELSEDKENRYARHERWNRLMRRTLEDVFNERLSYTMTDDEHSFPALFCPRVLYKDTNYTNDVPSTFNFLLEPMFYLLRNKISPYYAKKEEHGTPAVKQLIDYIKKHGTLHEEEFCTRDANQIIYKDASYRYASITVRDIKDYYADQLNDGGIYIRPINKCLEYNPKMAAKQLKIRKAREAKRLQGKKENPDKLYVRDVRWLSGQFVNMLNDLLPYSHISISGWQKGSWYIGEQIAVHAEMVNTFYYDKPWRHMKEFQEVKNKVKNTDPQKISDIYGENFYVFMSHEIAYAPGHPREMYGAFDNAFREFYRSRLRSKFYYVRKANHFHFYKGDK